MKKVTVILSFFILACAGTSFAQTPVKDIAASPATGSSEGKPKPKPKPKPSSGGTDYLLDLDGAKMEAATKGSNSSKPKPKPAPKPAPKPTAKRDAYLEIDGVKGESKDN